ncbi:MAG: histone-lysine N-methyltransferase [Lentisphaerae bacterium RIFOXYB12_FULL_65_16]|nr:MAG: histone-lysine N-methyltransferase [Lentisphaerae bacterium RIFOXYA12_64_32]OGV93943.1 MAG: histone-lysine N-methyltransferase [Lentisphaerae bacterium RIFOXYB12_FULL_65_16]
MAQLAPHRFALVDVEEPELFRDQFSYNQIPKVIFDGKITMPVPPDDIWITDTTFRDGQQARPPYAPEQIVDLYRLMNRLGGPNGVIRQCEFFIYSKRDRRAIEGCLELGCRYPEVTGWIRANPEDFKLVRALGLKETGILTSVSDYHIFLKLKKNRRKVMDEYLGTVKEALAEGIIPRCHFEDLTRADIYGFCLPFAEELMKLSEESGIPIKIRLCDTLGYGVSYPGAALPRSVPKLVHAFRFEAGVPAERLEWHGHNDFHKVHANATTAWLYGCSALNASLLGYGERCGNPPLEGAIIEYIGLKGEDCGIETRVITEIAEYYRDVVKAEIPSNYPFVGEEFNTTRAGIHADGILKNPEIYNIFDTEKILNRPIHIMVTDKSGLAGVAQWLNQYATQHPAGEYEAIGKRHPGVRRIYEWIMEQYEQGRTTAISSEEMIAQAKHHVPRLFESDFTKVKKEAVRKAELLAELITGAPEIQSLAPERVKKFLQNAIKEESAIQLLTITDLQGHRISQVHTQRGEKGLFRSLLNEDFSEREWFRDVLDTGQPYYSDLYFSRFTGILILTIAYPIKNAQDEIVAVIDMDFKFDGLTNLIHHLPSEILESAEPDQST